MKFCTTSLSKVYCNLLKYNNQPLFLGKFLRRGVPREIVSRATLGMRVVGSPTLHLIMRLDHCHKADLSLHP